jgi:hypothetical protein
MIESIVDWAWGCFFDKSPAAQSAASTSGGSEGTKTLSNGTKSSFASSPLDVKSAVGSFPVPNFASSKSLQSPQSPTSPQQPPLPPKPSEDIIDQLFLVISKGMVPECVGAKQWAHSTLEGISY